MRRNRAWKFAVIQAHHAWLSSGKLSLRIYGSLQNQSHVCISYRARQPLTQTYATSRTPGAAWAAQVDNFDSSEKRSHQRRESAGEATTRVMKLVLYSWITNHTFQKHLAMCLIICIYILIVLLVSALFHQIWKNIEAYFHSEVSKTHRPRPWELVGTPMCKESRNLQPIHSLAGESAIYSTSMSSWRIFVPIVSLINNICNAIWLHDH